MECSRRLAATSGAIAPLTKTNKGSIWATLLATDMLIATWSLNVTIVQYFDAMTPDSSSKEDTTSSGGGSLQQPSSENGGPSVTSIPGVEPGSPNSLFNPSPSTANSLADPEAPSSTTGDPDGSSRSPSKAETPYTYTSRPDASDTELNPYKVPGEFPTPTQPSIPPSSPKQDGAPHAVKSGRSWLWWFGASLPNETSPPNGSVNGEADHTAPDEVEQTQEGKDTGGDPTSNASEKDHGFDDGRAAHAEVPKMPNDPSGSGSPPVESVLPLSEAVTASVQPPAPSLWSRFGFLLGGSARAPASTTNEAARTQNTPAPSVEPNPTKVPEAGANGSTQETGTAADVDPRPVQPTNPAKGSRFWPFGWRTPAVKDSNPHETAATDATVQPPESLSPGGQGEAGTTSWWWRKRQPTGGSEPQETATDPKKLPTDPDAKQKKQKPSASSWFNGWKGPGQRMRECTQWAIDTMVSRVASEVTSQPAKFLDENWAIIKPAASLVGIGTMALIGATACSLMGAGFKNFAEGAATTRGLFGSEWSKYARIPLSSRR